MFGRVLLARFGAGSAIGVLVAGAVVMTSCVTNTEESPAGEDGSGIPYSCVPKGPAGSSLGWLSSGKRE